MFMPDQQRADTIGCFGNNIVQTPNIDALAARGMKFSNAYANHPVCGPSRVNLMTGWYPHTHGHRTLTNLLGPDDPNLLRYLKEGGYQVAWAGARGDVFAPGVTELSTHFCGFTTRPEKMGMGPQFEEGSALYDAFYHGKRQGNETWIDFDEASVRTAIDWLEQKPGGPWCLWIPLIFPHLPFEVEDPWYSQYWPGDMPKRISSEGLGKPGFHAAIRNKLGTDRLEESDWQEIQRIYYGMVSRVDDQLGRVIRCLEDQSEVNNTLVCYFTDHGEYLGDFGLVEKWPSGLDRCLVQNPLIMAGPGVSAGTTSDTWTEMVDLLPTLLEFAGIEASHSHFGKSLVPVLNNPSLLIRDRAYSEGGFTHSELNLLESARGEYAKKAQLQHEEPEIVGKAFSVRNDEFTYIYRLYEPDELYDRRSDPSEMFNLLVDQPDHPTAIQLKSDMMDWLVSTADEIPWEPDPRFPEIPQGQHQEFIPPSR
jgi:arylsulfatase A-like enzyme